MRNRFDYLGKRIGASALTPSGVTVVHDEISPNAHYADLRHEPDPAREDERARLGLLGRIASRLCLIEIYGHAPMVPSSVRAWASTSPSGSSAPARPGELRAK